MTFLLNALHLGKTRLCLQLATELNSKFEQGYRFVDLTKLSLPHTVPEAVLATLELSVPPGQLILTFLVDYLKNRQLLLVLDNCEHLLAACAELATFLLQSCPKLVILTTSREALGLEMEVVFPIGPLSTPPPGFNADLATVKDSDAVKLFVDRAKQSHPNFTLSTTNFQEIILVVHKLEGIPLAIELAAARLSLLSLEQLAVRLEDRFQILSSSINETPFRQQSLRRSLDWSYELLEELPRKLIQRLAVFTGGWQLEAAEIICSGDGLETNRIMEELEQLVNKSLVTVTQNETNNRFGFLEVIRQYASDILHTGDPEAIKTLKERHADYFLSLAQKAQPELIGPDQIKWAKQLELDLPNLRAVFYRLAGSSLQFEIEKALNLVVYLKNYWLLRGDAAEGLGWLAEAWEKYQRFDQNFALTINLLNVKGELEFMARNYQEAKVALERSVLLARRLQDKPGLTWALSILGSCFMVLGNYQVARHNLEEARLLCDELPDFNCLALVYRMLAQLADQEGYFSQANELRFKSLKLYREIGNKRALTALLNDLSRSFFHQGNYIQSLRYAEEGLVFGREVGYRIGIVTLLFSAGMAASRLEQYRQAGVYFRESLELCGRFDDFFMLAFNLQGLGDVAAYLNQPDKAIRLLAAASALREKIGKAFTFSSQEQPDYEVAVEHARSLLTEPAFKFNWAEGRALTVELALAEAQKVEIVEISLDKIGLTLTRREREVLRLLAEGLTNIQIADRLFLSPRTINVHLASIFTKLGVTSRNAATRYALENRLV